MYNTATDWVHNLRTYYSLEWSEVAGFLVTSLFGSFIFTFRDWGTEQFDAAAGLRALAVMFAFLFVVFFVTVMATKVFALRFGYQLTYEPHLVGVMAGLVIAVASNGYLPIFLTGGYRLQKPQRLYIGHWRGYNRPYEVALIASTFPLLMILYMILLNSVFLATRSELILAFIGALALLAIYSLIPLPNIALQYGGRVLDFFRYLKGMTFGLDVYMNSRTWYMPLAVFVLLSSILTYVATRLEGTLSIWVYIFIWFIALIVLYLYKTFVEQMDSRFRY